MSDLNDTIDRLLDNWELHNKLAEQTRQADLERERLIKTAFAQGADYSRLTIATGLTRTTLWRMRKRFDSEPVEAGWDITSDRETRAGTPAEFVEDTIRDLLAERFFALADDPDSDDSAVEWWDDQHLNDAQRALRDDVARLALRAQTTRSDTIVDPGLGIRMTRSGKNE
ncbi:hypothetical protein BISA_1381 [Bifidobacterium saguini DSM 23967]|uniref:Uncharacterized protein n=1 Tax=Bifidobacterium saguini DSM 23967 TaxID=1437607 RepID=A0A087DCG5_9BIFI|nr:hypothetical protein [Bifidobacterium saguini]KFI93215.1 hypothetical protein BISA_1381 [Bifidobacterium saguini DSM 23967]